MAEVPVKEIRQAPATDAYYRWATDAHRCELRTALLLNTIGNVPDCERVLYGDLETWSEMTYPELPGGPYATK